MAKPIPGAQWQAHLLDVNTISSELNRLWATFGTRTAPPLPPADGAEESRGHSIAILTRASTFNLIAFGRSDTDASRIDSTIRQLSDLYPSRTTILVSDPGQVMREEPGLDVAIALLEQPAEKGRPTMRFESVTVRVSPEQEEYLASIASPLLVIDLPDFLWWATDRVEGSSLFGDLLSVCDRLIVDSARFDDAASELRYLSALVQRGNEYPKLSDFAWSRLAPWRQIISQFFDPPEARPILSALDTVTIWFGSSGAPRLSGVTSALLLAGWLGSRLNWQAPGELLPARDNDGDWRITMRTGEPGTRRELILTLRPDQGSHQGAEVNRVSLQADGSDSATFIVRRVNAGELVSASEFAGSPFVERVVHAPVQGESELLADELRRYMRDAAYEAALHDAARLAPQSFNGRAQGEVAAAVE
ncbi:MAG: glucose-6-phosphate dehydrogenase assembly protein OpcA [Chloroflexota bacterium]|nr:glucose-6-phosphate dehydrogenase assembly protein OpcA [Chloroflexota bacterium]